MSMTHTPTATLVVRFCIVAIPPIPFAAIGNAKYDVPAAVAMEVVATAEI